MYIVHVWKSKCLNVSKISKQRYLRILLELCIDCMRYICQIELHHQVIFMRIQFCERNLMDVFWLMGNWILRSETSWRKTKIHFASSFRVYVSMQWFKGTKEKRPEKKTDLLHWNKISSEWISKCFRSANKLICFVWNLVALPRKTEYSLRHTLNITIHPLCVVCCFREPSEDWVWKKEREKNMKMFHRINKILWK